MNQLAGFARQLKKNFSPKVKDPKKPVGSWSEKDLINGKIVDTFVIILRTRGCSWALKSGCSMCGYFNDSLWEDITDIDLIEQFNHAMDKYSDQKFIKIFTSGSFLDKYEISRKVRKEILNNLSGKVEKLSVESRPEYINKEIIDEIKGDYSSDIFEIGIGLETADDFIRKNFLNKGFSFSQYKKACEKLRENEIKTKTYVLIKPPFLTEKKSIDDSIDTVEKIKKLTDLVSLNPTNVQKNTVVDYLWKRREYRPPWLFSIVEILKESKEIASNLRIKCDIAGGGNIRGAHNCRDCDRKFLDAITDFSLNQKTKVFDNLDCKCREKWLDQLDLEGLSFGSCANMYG